MGTLHIHLQEGFEGDEVVVDTGGTAAYRTPEARTRPQLGVAEMAEVQVPDGEVEVTIRVPGRGLTRAVRVSVVGAAYLGVSLEGNRIETRVSAEGFGYV
jgi:hypothetical protein